MTVTDFCRRLLASNRFLRFLLVGALNTLVGLLIYTFCLWIGQHYSISLMIATALGIFFNFKSTGIIVFQSRNNYLLMKFALVYATIYAVGLLIIALANATGIPKWFGGLFAMTSMALISYYLNSRLVFKS